METEINKIYINNINIISLFTTCRLRALTMCNLCALYTEHFQNKQLGIIRVEIQNELNVRNFSFLNQNCLYLILTWCFSLSVQLKNYDHLFSYFHWKPINFLI